MQACNHARMLTSLMDMPISPLPSLLTQTIVTSELCANTQCCSGPSTNHLLLFFSPSPLLFFSSSLLLFFSSSLLLFFSSPLLLPFPSTLLSCFPFLLFILLQAILIDKYRPETCCIIGNYYSLKSQHERAVQYFQRALKLNRNYLSAWTLIGHEYVELKNSPAAIDCYRRAVDINPRDYRAWYGLGQTYEILGMPYYALYYYRCLPHPWVWNGMESAEEVEVSEVVEFI